MEYFEVKGPTKLKGTFVPKGNKNAALPIIAATLLLDKPILLENLPEINDVLIMLDIIKELGGKIEKKSKNTFLIDASNIDTTEIPFELGSKIRTSILFAAPILAKYGKVSLPVPGGCVIGKRRLDTHFTIFEELGSKYYYQEPKAYIFEADCLKGKYIHLDEASVTGTENAIMAAVLAKGKTSIYNAACEPHVRDLCNFLNKMGAKIKGAGTNFLEIEGVENLTGGKWKIISDHTEVGSIIGLAAITDSDITIEDIIPQDYLNIKRYYNKIGIDFTIKENSIEIKSGQKLQVQKELAGDMASIGDSIWPGFPSDLMSIAVVAATQCKGTVLIFEKLFESRMFFVDKLVGMGANIVLCDPHRVVVSGKTELKPGEISSPDIRAGMAMLIAALIADGTSKIHNIRQIDRGYEDIEKRLSALGAKIQRIRD